MKTKNNIFYQSHFIAERMNAVETYLDELQDTPIYEAAQMILMESTGISQMEAEEIVNGLSEGLGLFKKSALQRDFSPKSLLEITSNLEAGKQHEVLTNMLTAFTMITDANDNKTAESLLEENKGKSVEVLAEELSELMKEGITGEKKTDWK